MDRTFEEFFLDFMAEKLGEELSMVITDEAIMVSIDERVQVSEFVAEANFIVVCKYKSKANADINLRRVARAVKELPVTKPMVLRTEQIGQDVDKSGAPRSYVYTGVFAVRFHDEDGY